MNNDQIPCRTEKEISTADLYDQYAQDIQIVEPIFNDYGKVKSFYGQITTIKLFEDNTLVRETLNHFGEGKVLVVDGGGSLRCALLGDNIADLAIQNKWNGVIIYGCVRDTKILSNLSIGIKAINHIPVKSTKRGEGQSNITLNFAGASIENGNYVYADEDGIIISKQPLEIPT